MHTYILFLLESNKVVYPCCVTIFPLDFKQLYSLKTKPLVSKNVLRRPQNDLGWLPGLGLSFSASKVTPVCPKQRAIPYKARPFLTNTQTASGGLKMTWRLWDQVYNFQHQKLPLYAQSREPFHTGHGRPFRTNMQANSSLLY